MRLAVLAMAGALALAPLAASAQQGGGTDRAPIRTTPFPDVPRDHWAYDAVEQMRQLGILRGYPPEKPAAPKRSAKKPTRSARSAPASGSTFLRR